MDQSREEPVVAFVDMALANWTYENRQWLKDEIRHALDDQETAEAVAEYAKQMLKSRQEAHDSLICSLCGFLIIAKRQPQNLEPSVN